MITPNDSHSSKPLPSPYHPLQFEVGILERLRSHLYAFANPVNTTGFLPRFYEWVLKDWCSRPYYILDDSYNRIVRTEFSLKDMQPTYSDFIQSLTGRQHLSSINSPATRFETLEKDFYDFFHEEMRKEGIYFLRRTFPNLAAEDFWDRIFMEEFNEQPSASLAAELCESFGFFASAAEPYLVSKSSGQDSDRGIFADWYLEDFKQAQVRSPSLPKNLVFAKKKFPFARPDRDLH